MGPAGEPQLTRFSLAGDRRSVRSTPTTQTRNARKPKHGPASRDILVPDGPATPRLAGAQGRPGPGPRGPVAHLHLGPPLRVQGEGEPEPVAVPASLFTYLPTYLPPRRSLPIVFVNRSARADRPARPGWTARTTSRTRSGS